MHAWRQAGFALMGVGAFGGAFGLVAENQFISPWVSLFVIGLGLYMAVRGENS